MYSGQLPSSQSMTDTMDGNMVYKNNSYWSAANCHGYILIARYIMVSENSNKGKFNTLSDLRAFITYFTLITNLVSAFTTFKYKLDMKHHVNHNKTFVKHRYGWSKVNEF